MRENLKSSFYVRNGIIYVQGYIDNKKFRLSTGKTNTKLNITWIKKNCDDVLLKLYNQKKEEALIKINKENFNDFALDSLKRNSQHRKDSTNSDYFSVYNKYIKKHFKYYNIKDIKKAQVQEWQNKMLKTDISLGRIKCIRTVFNGILTDAMQNELIEKNPFSYLPMPKREYKEDNEKEIKPFSLVEIEKILKHSTGQAKNILTLLFFTGMRTGECWGLKWEDINFTTKTIHIKRSVRHGKIGNTKTKNSTRIVEMLPIVEKALIRQKSFTLTNDSFIFLNRNKEHFKTSQSFSTGVWKRILRLAGIDYRYLYQTRHSFATLMISNGEDITWVSKMLGHANVRITLEAYTKYLKEDRKIRAVFLNKLEENTNTVLTHSNKPVFKVS